MVIKIPEHVLSGLSNVFLTPQSNPAPQQTQTSKEKQPEKTLEEHIKDGTYIEVKKEDLLDNYYSKIHALARKHHLRRTPKIYVEAGSKSDLEAEPKFATFKKDKHHKSEHYVVINEAHHKWTEDYFRTYFMMSDAELAQDKTLIPFNHYIYMFDPKVKKKFIEEYTRWAHQVGVSPLPDLYFTRDPACTNNAYAAETQSGKKYIIVGDAVYKEETEKGDTLAITFGHEISHIEHGHTSAAFHVDAHNTHHEDPLYFQASEVQADQTAVWLMGSPIPYANELMNERNAAWVQYYRENANRIKDGHRVSVAQLRDAFKAWYDADNTDHPATFSRIASMGTTRPVGKPDLVEPEREFKNAQDRLNIKNAMHNEAKTWLHAYMNAIIKSQRMDDRAGHASDVSAGNSAEMTEILREVATTRNRLIHRLGVVAVEYGLRPLPEDNEQKESSSRGGKLQVEIADETYKMAEYIYKHLPKSADMQSHSTTTIHAPSTPPKIKDADQHKAQGGGR